MSTIELMVRAPEIDICVRQSSGSGMPLLMLHGSGSAKEIFDHQFDSPLAEQYRLIAIDLPGHGKSGNAETPASGYTLSGLAGTVGSVIDLLELKQVALFGWSLGGHVAIQVAGTHPGIVGLMLTGTPPIGRGTLAALRAFHTRWDMLLASKEAFTMRDADRYRQLCFGSDHDPMLLPTILRTDGRLRSTFLRSMLRGDGVDQRQTVEHTPIPVAIVNGADDPIVRRSYLENLNYTNLWDDRCHVIAGAAHAPFREQPAQFNGLLHRFMREVELFARSARPQRVARRA